MPGDMDFRCDGHFRAHELHKRVLSITSPARASSVGGASNASGGRGAPRPKKMDTTRSAWRLLAERGARGFDVVHALGPILLCHLGLGIAERLAQCYEQRRRMLLFEFSLDHRDALLAIGFVVRHGRGRAHHHGCRCG